MEIRVKKILVFAFWMRSMEILGSIGFLWCGVRCESYGWCCAAGVANQFRFSYMLDLPSLISKLQGCFYCLTFIPIDGFGYGNLEE